MVLVSGWLRIGATVFGSVLLMGALSLSARASEFNMVDAQTASGDMVLDLLSYSNTNSQYTFTLQAANTGSQTYNDVDLVEQFVWDNSSPSNEVPLTWSTPNQNWTNASDTFAISGATGGTLTSFLLSDANTPLTWSKTGNPETVQSTDVMPAIALGSFGPGATQDFTMTCPSNFPPDVVGFFVAAPNAVPEPSTFVLLTVGGLGLLGYRWRRRLAA
jgi:hypothetical protein